MTEWAEHSYPGIRFVGGKPWRRWGAVAGYAVVAIIAVACDDPASTIIAGRAWLALLLFLQSRILLYDPFGQFTPIATPATQYFPLGHTSGFSVESDGVTRSGQ